MQGNFYSWILFNYSIVIFKVIAATTQEQYNTSTVQMN